MTVGCLPGDKRLNVSNQNLLKFMLLIKDDCTNNACVIFLMVTAGELH